jgi:hypothetical protein
MKSDSLKNLLTTSINWVKSNQLMLLLCTLSCIQYGCNSTSRRITIADKFLTAQVDSISNHLLKFSGFRKIDGVEKQIGSLYYVLSFKGVVSATKDCYWDGFIYSHNLQVNSSNSLPINVTESLANINIGDKVGEYILYKKGFGQYVYGVIVFEKRDSGWQITKVEINIDDMPDVKIIK